LGKTQTYDRRKEVQKWETGRKSRKVCNLRDSKNQGKKTKGGGWENFEKGRGTKCWEGVRGRGRHSAIGWAKGPGKKKKGNASVSCQRKWVGGENLIKNLSTERGKTCGIGKCGKNAKHNANEWEE